MSTHFRPKTFGKYRVDDILGEGAMGTVYRGYDPALARPVAIKTLQKALLQSETVDMFLERFRYEAQATAAFDHPSIVTIYDYGEELGIPYIVMEYLEGQDLKTFLDRHGRPDLNQTLHLMRQTLDALAYCHARGVVHRDLKLANIILLPDGRIKLTDFGIAHVEGSDLTRLGDQLGTPTYMAPEQLLGEQADARSDLFSAGVVLYRLLTGNQHSLGQALADIAERGENRIDPLLSPAAEDLLRRALAKRPEERFQSAESFATALARLEQDEGTGVLGTASPSTKRKGLGSAWLAVIGVAVALPIGWLLWETLGPKSPTPPPGIVRIASSPLGASVWQANRLLGITPQRIELPAGHHAIVLKLNGYRDLSTTVDVTSGAAMDFEAALEPLESPTTPDDLGTIAGSEPSPMTEPGERDDAQQDLASWNSVKDRCIRTAYEGYLKEWPNGRFADLARDHLKQLKRWKHAKRTGSIEDYRGYLQAYPSGCHADVARKKLGMLQATGQQGPEQQHNEPEPQASGSTRYLNVIDVRRDDALNMRRRPKSSSKIVGRIPHDGRCIAVIDPDQDLLTHRWLRVRYGGAVGWVNTYYLSSVGDTHFQVVNVKSSDVLNMRAEPDADSAKVGEIPPGDRCETEPSGRRDGRWLYVEYQGRRGWISSRFVAETSDCP